MATDFSTYVGKRFGKLVVERVATETGKAYNLFCRCDCGNTKIVRGYALRDGITNSCGCYQKQRASEARFIDLTGQKYGRLTPIRRVDDYVSPQGIPTPRWECKCDCGNTTVVTSSALRTGHISSCGCLLNEFRENIAPKDMVGKKFGTLTVTELAYISDKHLAFWKCKCECGNEVIVNGAALRNGATKSCGAGVHRQIHGGSYDRLYNVWTNIKGRCINPKSGGYSDYGGRGIKVCDEWANDYSKFREWAIGAGYEVDVLENGVNRFTIDRIDVNGNYDPSNCRWIENKEQQRNRRDNVVVTYKGETLVASDMADKYHIPRNNLWWRLKHGWSIEQAIETPIKHREVASND